MTWLIESHGRLEQRIGISPGNNGVLNMDLTDRKRRREHACDIPEMDMRGGGRPDSGTATGANAIVPRRIKTK